MGKNRVYIAIDLKSFYASVECVERGLDPLDACLVVADSRRTDKTICLAVSPALKKYGTGGRPRLFEVVQKVGIANLSRGKAGKSFSGRELDAHPELSIDYHVALPRMALYLDYSRRVYEVYLRFIAPEDIHVYSVDEVFIDATDYLPLYRLSAHDLTMKIIREVLSTTGITATAGIGTNLYLCKIAMDIVAKKMPADKDGVRIAELDEMTYRRRLWNHRPLTDFWRVGHGIAHRLQSVGLHTMGDVARCSVDREQLLYDLFGVNAELLIDHAWGWEPVTLDYVKDYEPETHSLSSGQVLSRPYTFSQARNVLFEMTDCISLELVEKRLVTDQIVLHIGYDVVNLSSSAEKSTYRGEVKIDHFGRKVPRHAHGTVNIESHTSACSILLEKIAALYDRIVDPSLMVRRIAISLNRLQRDSGLPYQSQPCQLSLFDDYEEKKRAAETAKKQLMKERSRQEAIIKIKKRFGKNAILRGFNYSDGATQRERNNQIGGHNA